MERDGIPVLTELMNNQNVRSVICPAENVEALYKWPTFTKPGFHEPTWENLYLILTLTDLDYLVKQIKSWKKKGILQHYYYY